MFKIDGVTDEQFKMITSELRRAGQQNHPFHNLSVIDHTVKTVKTMRNLTTLPTMGRVALLHDVGKAATKKINESTGYDTFYNHEVASIEFCDRIGIELTNMEIDLILEHDRCKSWVSKKKLHKLMRIHGVEFAIMLRLIVEADITAQSKHSAAKNMLVLQDLREWGGSFK